MELVDEHFTLELREKEEARVFEVLTIKFSSLFFSVMVLRRLPWWKKLYLLNRFIILALSSSVSSLSDSI